MKSVEQKGQNRQQSLYDKLAAYGQSDFYPYHMPGHKRSHIIDELADIYKLDITEIDGFDNLHHPEGILEQAQKKAAKLYGAEETFFLVNGSTCGVLAAVSAVTDRQDSILLARNCHKSVYHAAFLQELDVYYLYPKQVAEVGIQGAVCPADVETALKEHPECKAVVITSPTYEGIISDIGAISSIVHREDKILIVDEAHGAHLGLADNVADNAVRQGADIVIHSLHKMLPAMTQTALLHVNGKRVDRRKLRRYLSIYQSSSPSYVLMASMDACISYLEENAAECFQNLEKNYKRFMRQVKKCRYVRVGRPDMIAKRRRRFAAWDICKLVIFVQLSDNRRMNGRYLYDMLRDEFHLQMEMAADNYVLAIMTIADEKEGWQRLADALLQIDGRIEEEAVYEEKFRALGTDGAQESRDEQNLKPVTKMTMAAAYYVVQDGREVLLSEAAGEVAGDFISLYPPGTPLVIPGEEIDAAMIERIQAYREQGLQVQGVSESGMVIIC
ncbi:MAG: aminotransferase class V-fold PLP-dependent enzyme [Bacillus sp. (in: Bacteria)]|nr:aminotransferase class V-fold PLP-dependent enzyme [Bacillus sp. (in: firmicutes)]MCM1426227.1 aminotransferase class V-fold PLP-dependent enzyme [Eubacterium sp.]